MEIEMEVETGNFRMQKKNPRKKSIRKLKGGRGGREEQSSS